LISHATAASAMPTIIGRERNRAYCDDFAGIGRWSDGKREADGPAVQAANRMATIPRRQARSGLSGTEV